MFSAAQCHAFTSVGHVKTQQFSSCSYCEHHDEQYLPNIKHQCPIAHVSSVYYSIHTYINFSADRTNSSSDTLQICFERNQQVEVGRRTYISGHLPQPLSPPHGVPPPLLPPAPASSATPCTPSSAPAAAAAPASSSPTPAPPVKVWPTRRHGAAYLPGDR